MKKYRISLALKIPANFEVEVIANTKKSALNKAIEEYQNGEFNENSIDDIDWRNMELDIDEDARIDDIGNGIFIEEIK